MSAAEKIERTPRERFRVGDAPRCDREELRELLASVVLAGGRLGPVVAAVVLWVLCDRHTGVVRVTGATAKLITSISPFGFTKAAAWLCAHGFATADEPRAGVATRYVLRLPRATSAWWRNPPRAATRKGPPRRRKQLELFAPAPAVSLVPATGVRESATAVQMDSQPGTGSVRNGVVLSEDSGTTLGSPAVSEAFSGSGSTTCAREGATEELPAPERPAAPAAALAATVPVSEVLPAPERPAQPSRAVQGPSPVAELPPSLGDLRGVLLAGIQGAAAPMSKPARSLALVPALMPEGPVLPAGPRATEADMERARRHLRELARRKAECEAQERAEKQRTVQNSKAQNSESPRGEE